MGKTTLTMLTSILLGIALTVSAAASPVPTRAAMHHVEHVRGSAAARLSDRLLERETKTAAKPATRRATLPDAQYTIVDEPDADPGIYGTRVFGINKKGQISGQYVDSAGAFHAFLGTPDGNTFDFTPITVNGSDTFAGFVNDKGEIFGTYNDGDTGAEQGWVRRPDSTIETFAVSGSAGGTFLQGLNDKGVLTGNYVDASGVNHGFIRAKDGTIATFDVPAAGTGAGQGTTPIGIGNNGEVSGLYMDSSNVQHGFVRSPGGSLTYPIDDPQAGTGDSQGTYIYVSHGLIDCNDSFTTVDAPDSGTAPGQGTVAVEHREAGWSIGEYIDRNDVFHGYFRTKNGSISEFDPPGAGDIGTYTVLQSNRAHLIAGTFKDDNGIRHGFVRHP